jgi:hypothetical protein
MRRKAASLCPGSLPLKIKNAGAVWQALRRDAVMSLGVPMSATEHGRAATNG